MPAAFCPFLSVLDINLIVFLALDFVQLGLNNLRC